MIVGALDEPRTIGKTFVVVSGDTPIPDALAQLWPPFALRVTCGPLVMRPLRDTITRLNTEITALKASIENSGRTSNVQLTRLGDRLERVAYPPRMSRVEAEQIAAELRVRMERRVASDRLDLAARHAGEKFSVLPTV